MKSNDINPPLSSFIKGGRTARRNSQRLGNIDLNKSRQEVAVNQYNKNLKERARSLRKKPTNAEKYLWERLKLKHLGCIFYRQKPIGNYIVDFYCPKARLVIEIDGGHHFTPNGAGDDRIRDKYIRSLGIAVLRFPNSAVLKNTEKVIETIKIHLFPPLLKEDEPSHGAQTVCQEIDIDSLPQGERMKGT
jgi:very-short-patch-repair endonuclease